MPAIKCLPILSIVVLVLSSPAPAHTQDNPPTADPKIREAPIQLQTKLGTIDGVIDLPAGAGPWPVALIIAGSGPTDRDGNTLQVGYKHSCLKLLGQGLAAKGIAALRYDRAGIGKSAAAGPKEEGFRFEMLVDEATAWAKRLQKDARFTRVGIVGHSQGALVGMISAKEAGAAAFIALAGCGRPTHEVLRWQFSQNLPTQALKDKGSQLIDELAAGRTVADVPKGLEDLRPSVQPYLISLFKYDPAREIARLQVPVLIVQGTTDLQTPMEEAKILTNANKGARLRLIEGMNHVLKPSATMMAFFQLAAYRDPSIPLAPGLVDEVAEFLKKSLGSG